MPFASCSAALDPAAAAAEREAGDARARHATAGDGEAVRGGRGVELAPREAALGAHRLRVGVDVDALQAAQVGADAAVHDCGTCNAVPTSIYREGDALFAREGLPRVRSARVFFRNVVLEPLP